MKKVILILVPLLILGGVFGAAKMGMIQIPGISPKKAAGLYGDDKDALALYENDKPEPEVKVEEQPPVTHTPAAEQKPPEPDYELDKAEGRKKLAKLWNTMEVNALVRIIEDWKDEDLAPQLAVMDPEKVSQILAALDAKRASRLSKLIQEEASKVYQKD